jgi:hypothetical protein
MKVHMMLVLFPYLFPFCSVSCLRTREKLKTGPNWATFPETQIVQHPSNPERIYIYYIVWKMTIQIALIHSGANYERSTDASCVET